MKYTVEFSQNSDCIYVFDRKTNSLFVAIWQLISALMKYPVVTFRRKGIECEKCTADWCNRSPAYKEGETDD